MTTAHPMTEDNVANLIQPRLLVVDDKPSQVDLLTQLLAERHFDVMTATSRDEAVKILTNHTIDVALIDINLDAAIPNDRDGLYLASKIKTDAPEARVIFISRPEHLDAQTVLQMFNRSAQVTESRLAEAYVDKADIQAVGNMCQVVLGAKDGLEYWAPVYAKKKHWEAVKKDLNNKVGKSITDRGNRCIESERQCLQILRRLANDELMPLKEIVIDRVSHGRSRTIVLTMTAKYNPTEVSRLTVVKIGDRTLVDLERRNYLKWVPRFVKFASYPSMTGAASNRQLAGIGYSVIGEAGELAKTFVDQYWNWTKEDSEAILDKVFHSLLVPTDLPRKFSGTLRNAYHARFQQLNNTEELAARLSVFCRHCSIQVTQDNWEIRVGEKVRSVVKPTDIVKNEFYTSYWTSVVHGDLHGENIIVSEDRRAFLIDFAHTGEHHVFLDYVVMEVSIRMHLLRRLLAIKEVAGGLQDYITCWVEIEDSLAPQEGEPIANADCELRPNMVEVSRLASLIRWLRKSAWIHGYNDTYGSYYGGLGMACLTSPFLPDDDSSDKVRRGVRLAMLSCAAFSLDKARRDSVRRPIDDAMSTMETCDEFMTSLCKARQLRIGQIVKDRLRVLCEEASAESLRSMADAGMPILQEFRTEMPMFAGMLEQVDASGALYKIQETNVIATIARLVFALATFESVDHERIASIKDKLRDWERSAWVQKQNSV